RVGDDVDGHRQPDRPCDLQSLAVDSWRAPLPERREAFLVQRLQAKEHVVQPEALPSAKYLFVANQHVAASLEIVILADPAVLNLPGYLVALLGFDECHVVDDEHARFRDAAHVLDGRFRREPAVAAAVECPGAAERAVPGTASRELDGGGRVQHADEVLAAAPGEVARR